MVTNFRQDLGSNPTLQKQGWRKVADPRDNRITRTLMVQWDSGLESLGTLQGKQAVPKLEMLSSAIMIIFELSLPVIIAT